MKKLINHLRNQPPHVKSMVAFVTSGVVTAFLGLIWISNLVVVGINSTPEKTAVEKTPSPLALMYGNLKDFAKDTGNSLANVSSVFSFMESEVLEDKYQPKDIVTKSADGVIGISDKNYSEGTASQNLSSEE